VYLSLHKNIKNRIVPVLIVASVLGFGYFSVFKVNAVPTPTIVKTGDVKVEGQVDYTVTIRAKPEKRIPQVGHWVNQSTVEIRNPGFTSPITTQVVQHDDDGYATFGVDSSLVPPGNYDIAVKGYSHLNKVFPNKSFGPNTLSFDLSSPELLAGDTSVVEDNYINSMDFAFAINNLYTSNIKSDLNRDGVVNSLDIGNIVKNIYQTGDE
jgi:hypothetical protein